MKFTTDDVNFETWSLLLNKGVDIGWIAFNVEKHIEALRDLSRQTSDVKSAIERSCSFLGALGLLAALQEQGFKDEVTFVID